MDDALASAELEQLARRLGVEVRREALPVPGGLCQLRGRWTLFLDTALSVAEQVEVLVGALRRFDLSQVYVRPALRQLLEAGEVADGASQR